MAIAREGGNISIEKKDIYFVTYIAYPDYGVHERNLLKECSKKLYLT